jgi:hypothetical protein
MTTVWGGGVGWGGVGWGGVGWGGGSGKVSPNITEGEGGWQKHPVTIFCDFFYTLF